MKKSIVVWNNLAPGVTIVGGIGNITMSICPICEKSYYGSAFDHALEFEDDLHKAMCVIG